MRVAKLEVPSVRNTKPSLLRHFYARLASSGRTKKFGLRIS